MNVVAHDPFVAPDRAKQFNVELVSLEALVQQADFLTLHVVKTPEKPGMISPDLLDKAQPTLSIVYASLGRESEEDDLNVAIHNGPTRAPSRTRFAQDAPTTPPP